MPRSWVGAQPCHFPGPHQPLPLAGAARRGQDQQHGDLGGGDGEHVRGVADLDAAGAGGGDVDMIEADAERADGFDTRRQGGDGRGVEAVAGGGEDGIRALGAPREFGRGIDPILRVEPRLEQARGAVLHGGGQAAGDEEGGFGHAQLQKMPGDQGGQRGVLSRATAQEGGHPRLPRACHHGRPPSWPTGAAWGRPGAENSCPAAIARSSFSGQFLARALKENIIPRVEGPR